jgi:uncharacterized small protein (DUF1192 family)
MTIFLAIAIIGVIFLFFSKVSMADFKEKTNNLDDMAMWNSQNVVRVEKNLGLVEAQISNMDTLVSKIDTTIMILTGKIRNHERRLSKLENLDLPGVIQRSDMKLNYIASLLWSTAYKNNWAEGEKLLNRFISTGEKKLWDDAALHLLQGEATKILKVIEIQERINRLDNRLNEAEVWRIQADQKWEKKEATQAPATQINGGKNKKK